MFHESFITKKMTQFRGWFWEEQVEDFYNYLGNTGFMFLIKTLQQLLSEDVIKIGIIVINLFFL